MISRQDSPQRHRGAQRFAEKIRNVPKQSNTAFICQSCGYQSRKWLGKCPECGEWNSLVEERVVNTKKGAGRNGFRLREPKAVAYTEIASQDDGRISLGVLEFNRGLC